MTLELVLVSVLVASAGVSGCDGSSPSMPPSKCTGSLSEVGRVCPATFDGNLDAVPCTPPRLEWAFSCGDLLVLTHPPGTGLWRCSYDAASHALVGAEIGSDGGLESCPNREIIQVAGRLPPSSCYANGPSTQKSCP